MRLVIHAPTPNALGRARSAARRLLASDPEAEVEIVVEGDAVAAALQQHDAATDALLVFCGASLNGTAAVSPAAPVVALAMRYIAERQALGWAYLRA